jgi:hypothetical protein
MTITGSLRFKKTLELAIPDQRWFSVLPKCKNKNGNVKA